MSCASALETDPLLAELRTPILRPYQADGADFLASHIRALLADEMGLGKTVQAIAAADQLPDELPIVVACPAVARANWRWHFHTFSRRPLTVSTIFSKPPRGRLEKADVYICSYDLLAEAKLNRVSPRIVILDETHYAKNPGSIRSRQAHALAALAPRSWYLSGTPCPNHAGELWTLLRALKITTMRHGEFLARYTVGYDSDHGFKISGNNPQFLHELRAMIAPLMLRRMTKDVEKDIPPLTFGTVAVQPTAPNMERAHLFDQGEMDRIREIIHNADNDQTLLDALETEAVHLARYRRYNGLVKATPAAELIAESLHDYPGKAIIFAYHQEVIEILMEELKRFHPVCIYGETPGVKREQAVALFQNDPKCRVFVGQIQAAGTAITLTAASNVWMVEEDWVPGNNWQAIKRAHRIGQTKHVTVTSVVIEDGIDDRISESLTRKIKMLGELY